MKALLKFVGIVLLLVGFVSLLKEGFLFGGVAEVILGFALAIL